jgi:hypothetical protein
MRTSRTKGYAPSRAETSRPQACSAVISAGATSTSTLIRCVRVGASRSTNDRSGKSSCSWLAISPPGLLLRMPSEPSSWLTRGRQPRRRSPDGRSGEPVRGQMDQGGIDRGVVCSDRKVLAGLRSIGIVIVTGSTYSSRSNSRASGLDLRRLTIQGPKACKCRESRVHACRQLCLTTCRRVKRGHAMAHGA